MIHQLKTLQPYFDRVKFGVKTFEVRKNDRDFQVGDTLVLREFYDGKYGDQRIAVEVTYVLPGPGFGIEAGYCVMGFKVTPNV